MNASGGSNSDRDVKPGKAAAFSPVRRTCMSRTGSTDSRMERTPPIAIEASCTGGHWALDSGYWARS